MRISIQGIGGLKAMAQQIKRYPALADIAGRDAVNDVARNVITAAARDITQRYNLPASYIREQFRLREARSSADVAIVSARKRGVRLARFGANQITAAAPRAKGDQARKIASGRKQAGVSVNVLRGGSRKNIKRGFFMPLRAGKTGGGNGQGLFIREADGSLKHLYGRSPDQAFQAWITKNNPDLNALLAKAWAARMAAQLRKAS